MGLLYVLPPDEEVLRLAVVSGASPRLTALWTRVPLDERLPLGDAIRERRLVWLSGREEVARRYPRLGMVLPYDFMLAAAPFTHGAQARGGVVLLWPTWHPPTLNAQEREIIKSTCSRAGRLLQQAADQGSPLPVSEVPRTLTPACPPDSDPDRARAALDFTERVPLGCCALDMDGRVTFINATGVDLVGAGAAVLQGVRPWEALLWMSDPLFEDRYRAAVVSRLPTSFTALRPPDRWLSFDLYPDDRGITVHITPLAGNRAPTASRPPSGEPGGATALYHLMHLAAALSECSSVQDVVRAIADQLVPAYGPSGMALMTVEEGRLRIIAHRGYSTEFLSRYDGAPLTVASPPAEALATGDPKFFSSFEEFRHAYPEAIRYGERDAWAFLPLTISGRPIGSLVLSYDQLRAFPVAERAALMSMAGLIAQALDRARLYDTQHELARTLQTGLLPHTLPRIPGLEVAARYVPAGHGMEIGGDFYDLIRCGPNSAAAAIGDVQGHTIQAATLMGQVRTAVHAQATAGTLPCEVLARTNRLLTDLESDLFTSCLYTHLDLTEHRAWIATAGHPPPLLLHPDGHSEILDLPPGLLLGIDPDATYRTIEIPMPPGTMLALYTDGLVEAPGADIDHAIKALANHVMHTQDHTLDKLADAMLDHAATTTPGTDDVAFLLLKCTPSSVGRDSRLS
ncbi:SpoIIE family protein phosphatase [Streptomyces wuyuanensis]